MEDTNSRLEDKVVIIKKTQEHIEKIMRKYEKISQDLCKSIKRLSL
jgi:hypothetical protein